MIDRELSNKIAQVLEIEFHPIDIDHIIASQKADKVTHRIVSLINEELLQHQQTELMLQDCLATLEKKDEELDKWEVEVQKQVGFVVGKFTVSLSQALKEGREGRLKKREI